MCAKSLQSCPTLCAPWTVGYQAPLPTGFSRQEYWSGLPHTPPEDLPDPEIKPESLTSPALASGFFTTSTTWRAAILCVVKPIIKMTLANRYRTWTPVDIIKSQNQPLWTRSVYGHFFLSPHTSPYGLSQLDWEYLDSEPKLLKPFIWCYFLVVFLPHLF